MSLRSIDIVSVIPDPVRAVLDSSILRRAQVQGHLELAVTDLRSFATDKYRSVDDTPFGGKQGMLFLPEVLESAMRDQLAKVGGDRSRLMVVFTSPRGVKLQQSILESFALWLAGGQSSSAAAPSEPESLERAGRRIVIVCGRYEGVDERFIERWVDFELSLGDFVLTGGELPALSFTDGIVRLLPGVLGDERSAREDSFSNGLLEHPQYTKPRVFEGLAVPEALLSGHHAQMEEWKLRQALQLTAAFRPDLIRAHNGAGFPQWARELLEILKRRLDLRT